MLACRTASTNSWTDRLLLSKQIYMVRIERISVTIVQKSSFFIPINYFIGIIIVFIRDFYLIGPYQRVWNSKILENGTVSPI